MPDPQDEPDIVWQHLRAEFAWYHKAATRTRLAYQSLKTVSIAVAATVPVLAAVGAPPAWTASFAAVVVVLEGIQQLFQLHELPQLPQFGGGDPAAGLPVRRPGRSLPGRRDPPGNPGRGPARGDQRGAHPLVEHHAKGTRGPRAFPRYLTTVAGRHG